jgi:dipeptidyl aminopeptidase/acylaminoacyl peptidase
MDAVFPYGRWPSPLDAARAAGAKVSLADICSDGSALYWLESRPAEGGRMVFVREGTGGEPVDLTPAGVNIRSRVYEYGGGACCLVPGRGAAFAAFAYVDLADQRVWLCRGEGKEPVALSAEPVQGEWWAHGGLSASADGAWVVAVREVQTRPDHPPRRCIVALGTRPDNVGESILAQGHDFYGAPRLCPATSRLATVAWDHPDMPWDRSMVEVTSLEVTVDGATGSSRLVASAGPWVAEAGDEVSVGQPHWQRDGSLRFVSDRHGWWQPYTHPGVPDGSAPVALTSAEAEFHGPDWALGQSTMAELPDGSLVARMTTAGRDSVVLIGDPSLPPRAVPQPCVAIARLIAHAGGVAFLGASPDGPTTVWALAPPAPAVPATPAPPARTQRRLPAGSPLAVRDIAGGEPFSFAGRSGRQTHGLFYRPTLGGVAGPSEARPPLLVACHSGPTGSVGAGFDVVVQYFTSRGFALAAVDYAGSTGYGRDYRCSLWGRWGVVDAEDCVDAAGYLATRGDVDADRMAVRGSSSGALTALNALAAGTTFAAATSWYGVTDLLGLAESTHDFEAHYLDRLVGPLPASLETYLARSPVERADEMTGSVLLFQGLGDPVVPPAQAERLRDALLAAGRHCTVHFFDGESHGFRRAETLRACLEEELAFYQRELHL